MPNINSEQVARFADFLKTLPDNSFGLNFYSFRLPDGTEIVADKMYPPLEHPGTIDFFFFVCAHQYGFWYGDEAGYLEPMYGYFDGKKVKGSELIWRAAMRALVADETALAPRKLARISLIDFTQLFSDDKGPILFPNWEERLILTHSYGNYFRNTPPPKVIIEAVNKEPGALSKLIGFTQQSVPGYNEDPIAKKKLAFSHGSG